MPPLPASGDLRRLEQSPRASVWRSLRMLVMRLIILHQYPKFDGLPIPKIWLIFGHGIKQPGDLHL